MTKKLSKGLTGITGEYFAAAELSMRGYMAAVTLRNNEGVDILAYRQADSKQYSIQVKTVQYGRPKWPFNKKVENDGTPEKFYILVVLRDEGVRPDFYVVPSNVLSETVKKQHRAWRRKPGTGGRPHQESNMRTFIDEEGTYKERWDLLD